MLHETARVHVQLHSRFLTALELHQVLPWPGMGYAAPESINWPSGHVLVSHTRNFATSWPAQAHDVSARWLSFHSAYLLCSYEQLSYGIHRVTRIAFVAVFRSLCWIVPVFDLSISLSRIDIAVYFPGH